MNEHQELVEKLSSNLREQAAHMAAAKYRWLRELEHFDRIGGWHEHGCMTCVHWLGWACGIGQEAARERLRVARALPGLPQVCEAFESGRLSYSKVRALTRVATAETEALVEWALTSTAAQLENIVRKIRRTQVLKEAAHAAYTRREVTWRDDYDDESVVIKIRLPRAEARFFLEAVDALAANLGEDRESPTDGLSDLGSLQEWVAYTDDVNDTWSKRRADAVVLMAESAIAHGPKSLSGPDRHQIVVHVDEKALQADPDSERCHLENGSALAHETARRLACDASIVKIVEDAEGRAQTSGRRSRTIPTPTRRALHARDETCRFPSCTARRFSDAHHVKFWMDGGGHELTNLVRLCRFHHVLVHEGGYTVRQGPDEVFRFHRPNGEEIPKVAMCVAGRPDGLSAANEAAIEIDQWTPSPVSYEPRPDYGSVVGRYMNLIEGAETPFPRNRDRDEGPNDPLASEPWESDEI